MLSLGPVRFEVAGWCWYPGALKLAVWVWVGLFAQRFSGLG